MTTRVCVRRLPPSGYDVYMGRAGWCPPDFHGEGSDGYFGNPVGTVEAFASYFEQRIAEDIEYQNRISGLRGKRLACWCTDDKPCHVDTIIDWLDGQKQGAGSSEVEVLAALAERLVESYRTRT